MKFGISISLILFSNYLLATPDFKDKKIGSSPFSWYVSIDNKPYKMAEINAIKDGFKINNNKVNCRLEFNTEWDTKSKFAKKYGSTYDEKLWLSCNVGDTKIHPNAVGCTKNKNSKSDSDSLSISIGKSHIIIRCRS